MSLHEQLTSVSSKAKRIYDRALELRNLEKEVQEESGDEIRLALQNCVNGIQTMFQGFESIQGAGENLEQDVLDDDLEEHEVLVEKANELNTAFLRLAKSTEDGLSRASGVKRQSIELSEDVRQLNFKVSEIQTKISISQKNTNIELGQARSAMTSAKAQQASNQSEIDRLEEKLQDKKDDRTLLRVGRAAAWGTSLFFPPAALVAGGMEYGAHKLGTRIRQVKEMKEHCTNDINNIQTRIGSLQSEISELTTTANTTSSLAGRCKEYVAWCQDEVTRVKGMEKRLQGLDSVAHEMVRWARPLQDHTDLMKDIANNARMLREQAEALVQEVLKGGEDSLKEVCLPLRKLLKYGE